MLVNAYDAQVLIQLLRYRASDALQATDQELSGHGGETHPAIVCEPDQPVGVVHREPSPDGR